MCKQWVGWLLCVWYLTFTYLISVSLPLKIVGNTSLFLKCWNCGKWTNGPPLSGMENGYDIYHTRVLHHQYLMNNCMLTRKQIIQRGLCASESIKNPAPSCGESKLFFALNIGKCHLKKNYEEKSYPHLSFFGEKK